jgi:oligopeptide/dipeptide ABC transporter ATP-binding protein
VTIQAQILALMSDLRSKVNAAVILITHDLGVIARLAERVAVMYAGQIVEQADVRTIFAYPLHPYTRGLLGSIPILGRIKDRLDVIPGSVPNLINMPPGCRFAPRCHMRIEKQIRECTEQEPGFFQMDGHHHVRCWLYQDRGTLAPGN